MSSPKKNYYVGLSMAGTVSTGTYTAGALIELDTWLASWQKAMDNNKPVSLTALCDAGGYKKGDAILINPSEFPDHNVVISALTGASGGGASSSLYLIGLATGQLKKYLFDTWQNLSIDQLLSTDDISCKKGVYSLLNSKVLDKVIDTIQNTQWDDATRLDTIRYLADTVEQYHTLTSYAAVPYQILPFDKENGAGVFNDHRDYMRFSLSKSFVSEPKDSLKPYRYDLRLHANQSLAGDENWLQLLRSVAATTAFPVGFTPRQLTRKRTEYDGKFFYLKYSNPGSTTDYSAISPYWTEGSDPITATYVDGGTFNDSPHDLARASLLRGLNQSGIPATQLPHTGKEAFASVILIDPFAINRTPRDPASSSKEMPTLFQQIPLVLGMLVDQDLFHVDWIEKTKDEHYYSRFIILPKRPKTGTGQDLYPLAGRPLGGFGGFIDGAYRMHDYQLGHYNTWKFLNESFAVPTNNETVTYCQARPGENPEDFGKRMDKYRALGWLTRDSAGIDYCQIIPRFEDPSSINSELPEWPHIDAKRWQQVRELALSRAECLFKNASNLPGIATGLIWNIFAKSKAHAALDSVEKMLIEAELLKK